MVKSLAGRLIGSRLKEIPFIVFVSFLATFIVARSYVYVTNHDLLEVPWLIDNVTIRGVHVHHLSFGIVILSLVGFAALYDISPKMHRRLAIFYGVGLGLTFDEFALWLKLEDDYLASITYDAIVVISLLLLSIIYLPWFWKFMGWGIMRTSGGVIKLARAGKKRMRF